MDTQHCPDPADVGRAIDRLMLEMQHRLPAWFADSPALQERARRRLAARLMQEPALLAMASDPEEVRAAMDQMGR